VLQAYLDDSGTHTNDSPICVAAGYFGGAHYWKQFNLDWDRAVKSRHLTEFHASRFWSGGLGGKTFGEYAGWSKEDCETFLDELLAIIRRYRIWPVGSAVVLADWNEQSDSPLGRAIGKARDIRRDFKLLNKVAFDKLLIDFRSDFAAR